VDDPTVGTIQEEVDAVFRSIVVPVDFAAEGDRASGVAARLAAAAGLPVELLHAAPTDANEELDRYELATRAEAFAPARCGTTRVVGPDVVEALADALAERPDSLVVLGTSARGPIGEFVLGSVSEALLARTDHPVLLVGPHVPDHVGIGDSLVVAVNDDRTGQTLLPSAADLARCFGIQPWFVQVAPPMPLLHQQSVERSTEMALVHRLARELRELDFDAQWDVLHGNHVPEAIIDFTASMDGGIIAVASERWAAEDRIHWSSTARGLVHRSPFPVLVVPLHHHAVPA
jgi:nucleotide-binding universal stress UspA family protein